MAASISCASCANVAASVSFPTGRGPNLLRRSTVKVPPLNRFVRHGVLQRVVSARGRGRRGAVVPQNSLAGQAVANVQYVSGEEAKELVDKDGYTIVDIRDQVQYERTRIPATVHIPYFVKNEDNDIGTVIYRQLHFGFSGLFYGLAYTKQNTQFVPTVLEKFPKDTKLLLVCNEGLRSGYAAEKLQAEGYQNLAYISTGLANVEPGIFPKEGKVELKDGGKGGLVTVQGRISVVLGIVLVFAYLFLQFFPDLSEQLFFKSS